MTPGSRCRTAGSTGKGVGGHFSIASTVLPWLPLSAAFPRYYLDREKAGKKGKSCHLMAGLLTVGQENNKLLSIRT